MGNIEDKISQLEIEKQIWKRSSLDADNRIDELKAEVHRLREAIESLSKAQDDYANLLVAEINELVGIAYVHGWKSSRFEEGKKARELIEELKNALEEK